MSERNARAVALMFRVWSRFYDLKLPQELFSRRVHRRVLERWRPLAGQRVLDVGCGTGQLLRQLDGAGPRLRLAGVDLSREMLARAPRVALAHASVYALPFATGTFDVAVNTISSHFYLDTRAAFAEIARVLAPGGRFFCAALTSPIGRSVTIGLAVYHAPRTMVAHLAAAGLRVVARERLVPGATLFEAIAAR